MMPESEIEATVWNVVQTMNRAWASEGNAALLGRFFHSRMVAFTASDRLRLEGREACVASWQSFARSVRILRWEEETPRVQVFGEGRFAVVTYYYRLEVELEGNRHELAGRDLLALVEEHGNWLVVADHFSPFPGAGQL
ncbi:MAG: nuclear transport factor 2 family protein [Candidatus Riflebacteria bacterium]|nr:nuclear transport factor 2 family protein [Candidatus Riflebacteria bacterium]